MAAVGLARREWLALCAAAALAGCAPTSRMAPVRIGFQRSGVLLLAKSRGALKAGLPDGATVEWVEFPAGPPLMEAMAAGAIDFGAVGEAPPIFAQAAGAPIVYAAVQPVTGAGAALLVPAASTIRAVADLKGRKVAFTKASSAHLFMIQALKQVGLTLADIQPIHLSPGDASGAFASGSIDAWATWDPYYALAQRDQQARAILTGEALPRTNAFYIAARRLAEDRPATLVALLEALKAEAAWGEAHRGDVSRLIASATGLPEDIAAAALRRGPLAVRPVDEAAIVAQQASADIFRADGALPARVDVRAAAWQGWRG